LERIIEIALYIPIFYRVAMDTDTFGCLLAGVVAGSYFGDYYRTHVRPLFRVHSASGVSLFKINRDKAVALDQYLSNWSALFPDFNNFSKAEDFRSTLPDGVQKSLEEHINMNNDVVYASALNGEEVLKSWKIMFSNHARHKGCVKKFYRDPSVQRYLSI
jgi:hypothetical protein